MAKGRRHPASSGDEQERVNCFPTTSHRRTAVVRGQGFTLCSRAAQVWPAWSKRAFSSKEQKCTHISSRRREPTGWTQGRGAILCTNITVSLLHPSGHPRLRSASSLAPPAQLKTSCTWTHPSRAPGVTRTPSHMALLIQSQERVNLAVDQMTFLVQSADAGDVKNDAM